MSYKNKVVIVTGAGEGIGRSIAINYANCGAHVVVADNNDKTGRETVDLIYDQNGSAIFLQADVVNENDVILLMENVINCYGNIDILVNNVGVHYHKSMFDLSLDEWNSIINVNLRSVFLCAKEAGKYMKVMNQGAIVNIASSKSFMSEAHTEAYAAAKGGIISMTRSMAESLKEFNIQVNCISPGYVETKGYQRLKVLLTDNDNTMDLGHTDDIAKACLHLTQEDNDYVNGSNFIIEKDLIRKVVYID